MAILTISREIGSFGDEIANDIKDQLSYRIFDKTTIENELQKHNLYNVKIDKYDEKKPSILNGMLSDKTKYIHFLKSAMYNLTLEDNILILGRGGQIILKDIPGIINVRVMSKMNIKIERIKDQFECNEKMAINIIEESDQERRGFHKYFFDVDCCDNKIYDLIINTSELSKEACIDIIKIALESVRDEALLIKENQRFANLVLSQDVIIKLLYEDKLPIWFLKVEADNGIVIIKGSVSTEENVGLCKRAAQNVKGVKDVKTQIDIMVDVKKRLT